MGLGHPLLYVAQAGMGVKEILSLSESNIRWMEGVQLEGKSLHLGARCDLSFGFAVPEAFGLSFSSFGLRDCHLFFKVFFFV